MTDPTDAAEALAGCVLCHRLPVVTVGYYLPTNAESHAVVLRLRRRSLVDGKMPALVYGLCKRHSRNLGRSAQRADAVIVAMADRVTVQ